MPCDTFVRKNQTPAERRSEIEAALAELEAALAAGRTRVKVGPQGAVAFDGWDGDNRRGVTDVCAYRTLSSKGSHALRMAVAKAEKLAGRKVDARAVAAGIHSHDMKTWGTH